MIFQEPLNDLTQLDDCPPSSAGQRDARAYSKISNKIIKQKNTWRVDGCCTTRIQVEIVEGGV